MAARTRSVVEAAHAEGYLTAQYKAASEVDAARELKLYTETGLIAAVDVPRARPSLAVDQVLGAHFCRKDCEYESIMPPPNATPK
jgi:hypothetical protein